MGKPPETDGGVKENTSENPSPVESKESIKSPLTILDRITVPENEKNHFRHAETFRDLTREFLANASPDVLRKKEITCLYPGGGTHLGAIETALQVLESVENVEAVNMIYTEISDKAAEKTFKLMDLLEVKGLLKQISLEEQGSPPLAKGKEKVGTYEYKTKNGIQKKLKLTYALDRSEIDKGDNSYYRKEYADKADILISHDNSDDFIPSYFMGSFIMSCKESPESSPKAIFIEARQGGEKINWDYLPGKHVIIDKPYGHRQDVPGNQDWNDEMGEPTAKGALYTPDMSVFNLLSRDEVQAYLMVVYAVYAQDLVMDAQPGISYESLVPRKIAEYSENFFSAAKKVLANDPELEKRLYANYIKFLAFNMYSREGPKGFLKLPENEQDRVFDLYLNDDSLAEIRSKRIMDDVEKNYDFLQSGRGERSYIGKKFRFLRTMGEIARRRPALKTKFATLLRSYARELSKKESIDLFKIILQDYINGVLYKKYTSEDSTLWNDDKNEKERNKYFAISELTRILDELIPLCRKFGVAEIEPFAQAISSFIKKNNLEPIKELNPKRKKRPR